ncbi:MAG: sodium:solute symporter [Saprospiraceae bacterium]|nr:sodium:solute symporter [Saprospiraceae bacterium]
MHWIDWLVLGCTIGFIVAYGTWKTRSQNNLDSYIKGNNDLPWWMVGLSVMATQASAITFISTPGQAYHDGMGFVQFYFGLPIAMAIISLFFIPIYHKLKVFTAYEYLEYRFDKKTRTFAAVIFLIQRGMGAGITIYAPSIILATIFGWNLNILNVVIGVLVVIYTISGGTKAVAVTQKYQMLIIMMGLVLAFITILKMLPDGVGLNESLKIAAMGDKLNILDFDMDMSKRYTFWSGITGGTFLALAYFGTDQSQVQRYLAAKSASESQKGLLFNGLFKVPLQFFILLTGVMVFVFYQYHKAPIFFNQAVLDLMEETPYSEDLHAIESDYSQVYVARQKLLENQKDVNISTEMKKLNLQEMYLRNQAKDLISQALPDVETNDKDYVFISFILKYFPVGLIGLLMAVILSAAMSSTASEINSLGTISLMDLYLSHRKKEISESDKIRLGKWFTFGWGIAAIAFACMVSLAENLIQLVNIIGSIFYGTVLGLFLLGFFIKKVKAKSAFISGVTIQMLVILIFGLSSVGYFTIGYLWLNAIGCLGVIAMALILETIKIK